jgi:6-phosphogluconolactonase
VNAAKRTLYTANYTGSSISVFRALPDGSLVPAIQHLDLKDTARFGHPGPHRRQGMPHPHCVTLSPDGKFAVVNDLGNDSLDVFTITPDGRLSDDGPTLTKTPPVTGPRHIAFHPNGRWVYGINELNNTLRQYQWQKHGNAAELHFMDQSISTLAPNTPDSTRLITASEVAISPDGRFLYTCNRGDESLTVFDIAPKDGTLSFKQRISCGGKEPRHFTLDPSARWIICCNDNSAAVTVFRRDRSNGTLTGPVQTVSIDAPEFALFS